MRCTMPMVNSLGATKKAPYADAPRSRTTAAAPRSFAVIFDLRRPVPSRSFVYAHVLCYEQIRAAPPASPLLSHRFRKPGVGVYIVNSLLQEIFPEKPYRRQKNDVERNQERQPVPPQHRIFREQRRRGLRAGDKQRRQQRQKEQREQQLAHSRLR